MGNDRITVGQPMKRYQKILVRQNRAPGTRRNRTQVQGKTGPGARQSRAGRKAKQGRVQGKAGPGRKAKQGPGTRQTGPDADTGITGKDPLRRKTAKNAAESLFSYLGVTFPVLLNTELKTGILTGLRRSRGYYDIPLSKATTEKRPAGIDRALFC